MPRISMWKDGVYGVEAKYIDNLVYEQFVVGGTDIYVHKYIGSENPNITNDATQPVYSNLSEQNIQDLLFLENRDRKYEQDVIKMRCHFSIQDLDLDLSQFGLMLGTSGMLSITVHLKNCVDLLGRKLMSGDVLEIPCLKDFYALDETIPVALKRYYVVQSASHPAAGVSPTWWNHLWKMKCTPMVNSQEYSDILNKPVTNAWGDTVTNSSGNAVTYANVFTSGDLFNSINDAVITQAENNTPLSGYDTNPIWEPLFVIDSSTDKKTALAPGSSPQQKFSGYNVGNGQPEDGYAVTSATEFPSSPTVGQYVQRTDYFPPRLYRWSGIKWQFVNANMRTPLTNGLGHTQRDAFINNANTFVNSNGNTEPVLQNLSTLFRPDRTGNSTINT